jgi:hypothetical protein
MNGLIELLIAGIVGSFFGGIRSLFGKWMIETFILRPLKKLFIRTEHDFKLYIQMRHEADEKRKAKIK